VASSQSTDNDRQLALEKNAVHFVLLMQQYQNPEERDIILTQALKTETNGCDNTSLQIVCHSKLACTEAFRENNDAAQAYITQAKALCENISPCFALTSAYHDDLFLQTLFFSNEQSDETSESALKGSESALLCMFEEQKEVQVIWKRIILQYMVMSLLKIKLDFKVHRIEITKENVTKAKELLHEIEKNSQDIEKRRQMIKSLCYGVVYEMEGDLDSAKAFLEEALDIARDGGCFHTNELHNIEDYHAHLSAQTSRKYISS
jgi:tetratricopeptide (TPR) repeat protein